MLKNIRWPFPNRFQPTRPEHFLFAIFCELDLLSECLYVLSSICNVSRSIWTRTCEDIVRFANVYTIVEPSNAYHVDQNSCLFWQGSLRPFRALRSLPLPALILGFSASETLETCFSRTGKILQRRKEGLTRDM